MNTTEQLTESPDRPTGIAAEPLRYTARVRAGHQMNAARMQHEFETSAGVEFIRFTSAQHTRAQLIRLPFE